MKASLEIHAARMRAERAEELRKAYWRNLQQLHSRGLITLSEVKQAKTDFWLSMAKDERLARMARRTG